MTDTSANNLLLDDYFDEAALARELRRSRRTLAHWRELRFGPPVTHIGRSPFYHKASVREWLRSREIAGTRRGLRRG
jgi:hypothetical protein